MTLSGLVYKVYMLKKAKHIDQARAMAQQIE